MPASAPAAGADPRLGVLAGLLALARDVAQAPSEDLAAYAIVNQSFALAPYQMALLWRPSGLGAGRVSHVSGLATMEGDSPFVLWINALVAHRLEHDATARSAPASLSAADFPPRLAGQWDDWLPEHLLWLPLPAPAAPWPGVLCVARHEAFEPHEVALLREASLFFGQALWGWRRRHLDWRARLRGWRADRRVRRAAWLLAALLLLPLRQSVVVSGEVVPLTPLVLAAPADAPIRRVLVRPNQAVKAGQPLFELDDTGTRNRLAVARKSLEIAQADWLRSSQKGFADDNSRAEVAALSARIEEKQAELAYLGELTQRLLVRAPSDGVAVFSDALELTGRPVVTGEHIMTLSDPGQVALQAWLPPADAIALGAGAEMSLSLYTSPLGSLQARLEDSSYETQVTPDGGSAYRVRGRFVAGVTPPHLGLKGSVRLYGARAPLIYHMLRRPLVYLRRLAGI